MIGWHRDDPGILFCQQLAVDVAHLHRTDGRCLYVGEARLLNWSTLITGQHCPCLVVDDRKPMCSINC